LGFRRVCLLLLCTTVLASAAPPSGEFVGAYSNVIATGEHARGFIACVCREGTFYYGVLFHSEGLNEDMPLGVMEDLRVVPETKAISFKARLTMGSVTASGDQWVPSRDVYQFQGTLFPDQMSGEMIHADLLNPSRPATHESIKLYRSPKYAEQMRTAPTAYKEWLKWVEPMLQARGPKW
jgi:hypothetical protein